VVIVTVAIMLDRMLRVEVKP